MSFSKPHEMDPQDPEFKQKQQRMLEAIIAVAVKYLLFERETETLVRHTLADLAQERHNEFHTKGEKKDGDGTSFQDCDNEVCRTVFDVLETYQKPAIEFNQITAELMETKFDINVLKGTNTVVVSLKEKGRIDEAPVVPTPVEKGLKIKV